MLHRKISDKLRLEDEIKKSGHRLQKKIPEMVEEEAPEVKNYEITLYWAAIHSIVSEITLFTLPTAETLYHPGLNYLEASTSILRGSKQLLDDESHRPLVTKVKGFSNIATGIGLTVITAVGTTLGVAAAAALSAQGMAAALGVAFVISCDEVIRAARRMEDPGYWLSDSLKQWDKLNEKTIPKLQEEIKKLERTPWIKQRNSIATWALNHKKERLAQLQKSANELAEDIKNRVETNEACWQYYEKNYMSADDPLSKKANQLLIGITPDFNHKKAKEYEEKIQEKCKKDLIKSVNISLLTGIAFTGMLLLCIPGAQPVGAILIGITAAVFAVQFAEEIVKKAPIIKGQAERFFKNKAAASAQDNAVELQPLNTTRKI